MFKEIKHYLNLLNKFNSSSNLNEINKNKKGLEKYIQNDLKIFILDLPNFLSNLGVLYPIGLYFDYFDKNFINQENIIYSEDELRKFLENNMKIIFETGGLNCFVDIDQENSFLQLHYQDTIINYQKNK